MSPSDPRRGAVYSMNRPSVSQRGIVPPVLCLALVSPLSLGCMPMTPPSRFSRGPAKSSCRTHHQIQFSSETFGWLYCCASGDKGHAAKTSERRRLARRTALAGPCVASSIVASSIATPPLSLNLVTALVTRVVPPRPTPTSVDDARATPLPPGVVPKIVGQDPLIVDVLGTAVLRFSSIRLRCLDQ